MLLPNESKPEFSIYYNSSLILKILKNSDKEYTIEDLYKFIKAEYDLSLKIFSYCMDWLFLIEAVNVDSNGDVKLCT